MYASRSNTTKKQPYLLRIGTVILVCALLILLWIYRAALWSELTFYLVINQNEYQLAESKEKTTERTKHIITPINNEYAIVIPRIAVNAPIIADVDPLNEVEYQETLSKGVAHAHGTSHPGMPGNTFIFAHSTGNFYSANRYNAVFYLLGKLKNQDRIVIMYRGKPYDYTVTQKQIVNSSEIEYLYQKERSEDTLTLMTCWPAGTTAKRLLVHATLANSEQNLLHND